MINQYLDSTMLSPTCSPADIKQLCLDAIEHKFKAVCVPPVYVTMAKKLLKNTPVQVATVISFPFGYNTSALKMKEVSEAFLHGADEIDVVLSITLLKIGFLDYVRGELQAMKALAANKVMKVIIEASALTEAEKITACQLVNESGAEFLKTSTGYGSGGATLADIALFKKHLAPHVQIKASGGIRTYQQAKAFIDAGCTRIGTSNAKAIYLESL